MSDADNSDRPKHVVREAGLDDVATIGQLLDAFNREYDEPTPGPSALADRMRQLLGSGDTEVLLGGLELESTDGLAVLRFRGAIWSEGLECYVAELYVVPSKRGHGLGRVLMERALAVARERGADHIDLGTSEDDVVARHLYERLGFTNRERLPDGPIMYVYEREL